jgi:argininosuccinate synthase
MMKHDTNYVKVASYEAHKGTFDKCLLLYSGGLDTSVMLKWIQDTYGCEVVTLTLNLGQQQGELEAVRQKALKCGAAGAIVLDVRAELASEFIAKGIKANAHYQGEYHLSTPIARAITAKKAVEVAQSLGIGCIAHGSTGKGNDQLRFDGYIVTLDPTMKIIAPVREWGMDRNEEIAYAKLHGIPVPASVDFPYSDDDNMWGITWEGGEITDPGLVVPEQKFLITYTLPKDAPEDPETIELTFERGLPTAIDGDDLPLADLIAQLNAVAGAHGVGTSQVLEDRVIGLKNRGVYEHPAAHTIIAAHRYLEQYVSTRQMNELKEMMDTKWGYLCYGGLWYDQTMTAINAFNDTVNEIVTGTVKVRLFKGQATVVAVTSPNALSFASFNNDEGYNLNTNVATGFIELYTLQMKLAHQITSDKASAPAKVHSNVE